MDLTLLVTSIALGLTVAAPIGPMSLLCINRTLLVGRSNGLVFGAGIAAADCTYAALASFGLVGLSSALAGAGYRLKILGAFLLIYLGVRLARGRLDAGLPAPVWNTGIGAFASAYGLTLAKPQPGHTWSPPVCQALTPRRQEGNDCSHTSGLGEACASVPDGIC